MKMHIAILSKSKFRRFFLVWFLPVIVFASCTLFFSTTVFAGTVKLAWDANSESDLQGYKIYYKTGSSGAPYDGIGADQGPSGIALPLEDIEDVENPAFTLTGLPDGQTYYLVITAYNDSAESGYSNEVIFEAPSLPPTTHTITAEAVSNGSITPSGMVTVNDGDSKVYAITPDANYHIIDVKVDGSSVGAVAGYTFNNITTNHTISATFGAVNEPPTANAGSNRIVPEGDPVVLDGSGSRDSDGSIVAYHWQQTVGPAVTLSDTAAVKPGFTAPQVSVSGATLTFQLTVTDNGGLTNSDTVSISVNDLVSADRDGDGVADEQDAFPDNPNEWLDSDGDGIGNNQDTDDDNDGMPDTWEVVYGLDPLNNDAGQDADSDGFSNVLEYQYQTNPADENSIPPQTPVAMAGFDQTVMEGRTVTLDGSASYDSDGSIDSYQWEQIGGVEIVLSDETAATPTFVPPPISDDNVVLTFNLKVTDEDGLEDNDRIDVIVQDNGITGFPTDVLTFYSIDDQPLAIQIHEGGHLVRLEAVDPESTDGTEDRPEFLPYGLIDMDVRALSPGGSVILTVYLPEGASEDAIWYNYSDATGWQDYSSNSDFNETRDQVTIVLTDGGSGDNDRQVNSMILDPSGLGSISLEPAADPVDSTSDGSGGGGGGGGCFISAAAGTGAASIPGYPACWILMALVAACAFKPNFLKQR